MMLPYFFRRPARRCRLPPGRQLVPRVVTEVGCLNVRIGGEQLALRLVRQVTGSGPGFRVVGHFMIPALSIRKMRYQSPMDQPPAT